MILWGVVIFLMFGMCYMLGYKRGWRDGSGHERLVLDIIKNRIDRFRELDD